jgi:hypothetical protein
MHMPVAWIEQQFKAMGRRGGSLRTSQAWPPGQGISATNWHKAGWRVSSLTGVAARN